MKYKDFFFESDASDEAHKKGYKSAGWGKWKDKSGNTVAKTEKGKLVPLNKKEKSTSPTPEQPVPDVPNSRPVKPNKGTGAVDKFENELGMREVEISPNTTWGYLPTPKGAATVNVKYQTSTQAELHWLVAERPGAGRAALEIINKAADKHGVTLSLWARPLPRSSDNPGPDIKKKWLERYYENAGFKLDERDEDGYARMIREPASSNTPENILAQKVDIGVKPGMNEGGTYKGKDGKVRYVKFYRNPIVAHDEKLCNDFYRDFGVKAPASTTFQHNGKTVFASVMIEDVKGEVKKFAKNDVIPKKIAKEILKGFVADCFMANWDALGMNEGYMRNMLVLEDGKVARIDQGGALLTGGLGQDKPEKALSALAEWEYFPTQNPSYQHVFRSAGISRPEQIPNIKDQINRVLSIGEDGWDKYIQSKAPEMPKDAQQRIVKMLEARTKILKTKLKPLNEGSAWKESSRPKDSIVNDKLYAMAKDQKVSREVRQKIFDAIMAEQALQGKKFQGNVSVKQWADGILSDNKAKLIKRGVHPYLSGKGGEYRVTKELYNYVKAALELRKIK